MELLEKKDVRAAKEELHKLLVASKEDILKLQVYMDKRFNQITILIVGVFIVLAGIIIAFAKH